MHTSKVIRKNVSSASIERGGQTDILTASRACKVHTPSKTILAETNVFCLSGRPGWHRPSAAEVGCRLCGGVAGGSGPGSQRRGDYSSYRRRTGGPYRHSSD